METCCPGHLRSSNPSKCGQPATNLPTPVRQWGPFVRPVVLDPSSVRSNVQNLQAITNSIHMCINEALLEIQVDAMQVIPRARENQSPFPVITWLNLSLASTSFSYREAMFFGRPE